ncbi:MAG: hypothetical protein JW810_11570 [Sedimentisphaerales bacterium]|nr:hypothetical protein [Sedimentisphaerales bacterium]
MKKAIPFNPLFLVLALLMVPAVTQGQTPTAAEGRDGSAAIDIGRTGEPISPYIYGQFIEHLGRCIYGGIWAEMLEDRKFYYPVTGAYAPYGRRQSNRPNPFPVVRSSPWQILAAPDSVQMTTDDPFVGVHTPLIQPGGGIRQLDLGLVNQKDYVGYLWLKCPAAGAKVTVSLCWGEDPAQRDSVPLAVAGNDYRKYPFQFKAGSATDQGILEIQVSNAPCLVGTVSLMPADNVDGLRADTLALLKELNAPVYRWPGGNFVSGYDWRDGIGDRDRRPPRRNPAWTGVEHNDFGFHEFIHFCRRLNAEPLVTVNTGFGDAYSAAAQLEYANGSAQTLMGALRGRHGDVEPFGVRFWCIGNEMFGSWQLGHMSLEHYVQKHNWVVDKMRQVDPDIVALASGNAGPWSEGLCRHCADRLDLIAEHFYCQEKPNLLAHTAQIADQIKQKVRFHRDLRQKLDTLKDKNIRIAMTEWNYWYGPHVFGELGTRYFLKDALGIARGLHEYFRQSDIVFMANYAQTVNVIGCIKAGKTDAAWAATGLVLKLYRNQFGQIPVAVSGSFEPLDVSAALTADRQMLTVAVVNATGQGHNLALSLGGTRPPARYQTWTITGPDERAYNEPGAPPAIEIQQQTVENASGRLSIAPLSVTLAAWPVP